MEQYQDELLYHVWKFSCICQIQRINQGTEKEWKQLQDCMQLLGERADSDLVARINQEMDFYAKTMKFVSDKGAQTYEMLCHLMKAYPNSLIIINEMKQVEGMYKLVQECKSEFKQSDRLPKKSWQTLLKKFQQKTELPLAEAEIVKRIIERCSSFEAELKKLKKLKQEEDIKKLMQPYFEENFAFKEADKLAEKYGIADNEASQVKRQFSLLADLPDLEAFEQKHKDKIGKPARPPRERSFPSASPASPPRAQLPLRERSFPLRERSFPSANAAFPPPTDSQLELSIEKLRVRLVSQSRVNVITLSQLKGLFNKYVKKIGTQQEFEYKELIKFTEQAIIDIEKSFDSADGKELPAFVDYSQELAQYRAEQARKKEEIRKEEEMAQQKAQREL